MATEKNSLAALLDTFPVDDPLSVSRRRFIAAGVGATAAGLGLVTRAGAAPAGGNRVSRGLSQGTPPADAAPPEKQVIIFPADVNTAKVLGAFVAFAATPAPSRKFSSGSILSART